MFESRTPDANWLGAAGSLVGLIRSQIKAKAWAMPNEQRAVMARRREGRETKATDRLGLQWRPNHIAG